MKRLLLILCLIFAAINVVNGQEKKSEKKNEVQTIEEAEKPFQITHGPYLCDMTQDGVTVVWTTNRPAQSWIELAPEGDDSFYAKERPRYYETEHGRRRSTKTLHSIRLKNLEPGTKYRYRIFSRETINWKYNTIPEYGTIVASNVYYRKPYEFRTYPNKTKDISFLVYNDVHANTKLMSELGRKFDFKKFDFVAFNGDMSNYVSDSEQMLTAYMDTAVAMFASETPIMYIRGNHETRGQYAEYLIDNFPTRDGKFYQLYMVGDVCFLALDGGEDKPDSDIEYNESADYDAYREEVAEWLKKVVETPEFKTAKARIVFLHIPPLVSEMHADFHLTKLFMPILNRSNVDVMLSGHTHEYLYFPVSEKNTFPIVVNDNKSYLKCDITKDKIHIKLAGVKDSNIREHSFSIKH